MILFVKTSRTLICTVHHLDIQYPPYSISLCGELHREAVSTILKSLVWLGPGWIRTQDFPHSERTLYHYATESVFINILGLLMWIWLAVLSFWHSGYFLKNWQKYHQQKHTRWTYVSSIWYVQETGKSSLVIFLALVILLTTHFLLYYENQNIVYKNIYIISYRRNLYITVYDTFFFLIEGGGGRRGLERRLVFIFAVRYARCSSLCRGLQRSLWFSLKTTMELVLNI